MKVRSEYFPEIGSAQISQSHVATKNILIIILSGYEN